MGENAYLASLRILENRGWLVELVRTVKTVKANLHYASIVFRNTLTEQALYLLKSIYRDQIIVGGSGFDLKTQLPENIDLCFPDYSLYHFDRFLTRGCDRHCPFLASHRALAILEEIIRRDYRVNFSQTLDIRYLNDEIMKLLRNVKSMNSRFRLRQKALRRIPDSNDAQAIEISPVYPTVHAAAQSTSAYSRRLFRYGYR